LDSNVPEAAVKSDASRVAVTGMLDPALGVEYWASAFCVIAALSLPTKPVIVKSVPSTAAVRVPL